MSRAAWARTAGERDRTRRERLTRAYAEAQAAGNLAWLTAHEAVLRKAGVVIRYPRRPDDGDSTWLA